jgi:hypothetical protein
MQYALLIAADEAADSRMTPEEQQAQMGQYDAYTQATVEAGVNRSGAALHPSATATTVRVRDGKAIITDGPFAETKEQLAGFYIIECDNLDQALEWAAKIPHAASASVEVRPILDM